VIAQEIAYICTMSVLEKFGVEIFTQHNIFERISVDKPFRPDNPAFIFVKTGSIKLKQHFRDLELSANMFMVTDPQTVYEMISISDDFQSRMVSYKREFISALSLKFNRLITYRYFRQQMNIGVPFRSDEMEVVWKSVNFLKYILDSETEMTYKKKWWNIFFCFLLSDGGNYFQRRQQFHEPDVQTGRNCFYFLNDLANITPMSEAWSSMRAPVDYNQTSFGGGERHYRKVGKPDYCFDCDE
jgi:hypothetical protein